MRLPQIFHSIFSPGCGHSIAWRHFCINKRHRDWETSCCPRFQRWNSFKSVCL